MKGLNAQARQGYLRALELDPNNTAAMSNLSIQEIMHGRLDEGASWGRRFFLPSGKGGNDGNSSGLGALALVLYLYFL